jgi:hypothetical protein
VIEVELAEQDKEPVPGAATGMVVSTLKSVGSKMVKTHAVDIKFLEELRATEEQIARELGQWVDKTDNTQTIKRVEDIPTAVIEDAIRRGEEKLRWHEAQGTVAKVGQRALARDLGMSKTKVGHSLALLARLRHVVTIDRGIKRVQWYHLRRTFSARNSALALRRWFRRHLAADAWQVSGRLRRCVMSSRGQ